MSLKLKSENLTGTKTNAKRKQGESPVKSLVEDDSDEGSGKSSLADKKLLPTGEGIAGMKLVSRLETQSGKGRSTVRCVETGTITLSGKFATRAERQVITSSEKKVETPQN